MLHRMTCSFEIVLTVAELDAYGFWTALTDLLEEAREHFDGGAETKFELLVTSSS